MKRGRLKAAAVVSSLSVLLALVPDPVSADGNAGVHLHKFVDPVQLTINPGIGVTLAVDKSSAIPGDTLTYTAVVTNPTATFGMGGYIDAESVASAEATVAYYWDQLEICAQGCGTGVSDPHWTGVVAFETGQSGYQPVQPPSAHTGMTLAAQPVNRTGVTYPASGDRILGTVITPKALATWTYLAKVELTPAQAAVLSDPVRAAYIRNVLHFEVTVRNVAAAQPYTDQEAFGNPFTTMSNPAAIHGITVTFTLPDGTTSAIGPAQVPALGLLSPGGSATATTTYRVPVPGSRPASESERAYAVRLVALDGAALSATALASGTGFSGNVYATSNSVTTIENVPIVTIAKAGPASIDAGQTENNPLTLTNAGGATASSLAIDDSVPGGGHGIVSGVPATLATGASASPMAAFPVPANQAEGNLTDTAAVTWKDANGNPYGPFSSSFTTVVRNLLAGGRLTLVPVTAGPNPLGATQNLTATLVDRNGDPVGGRPVTLRITGANPSTLTATTDPSGDAHFAYAGVNSGTDVAQATFTAGSVTLTSNTSSISWGLPVQPIVTSVVDGNFFANPNNSCTFGVGPSSTPVFGQSFPDILFNPPASAVPHNISTVNTFTRPFTDLTVDINGNYNGQIVAQGNGAQAGTGSLVNFYAELTGSFIVKDPGDLTLTILHDDGYVLGVGGGATRVNGDLINNPASTAFQGYPVAAAFNQGSAGSSNSGTATIHFPAAGTYPYELDYTECAAGELFLVLQSTHFVAQTDPLSVYVGYADGLRPGGSIFPFPWQGSPNVIFQGGGCCDNGAVRFDNSGTTPIAFDSITVDVGPFHYDLWPRNMTLPAGQILILTGTGGENFDTSDAPITCSPTGYVPEIHVTSGGVLTTFRDSTQILNTGGIDPAVCSRSNESHAWIRIGGGGNAINSPLPPGASLDISPFRVANALLGQNQALTVSAMDSAGNPVANLPVTLQVFGPNAQSLNGTTLSTGLATFGYVGVHAGTDSIQAGAFIGGLRQISNLGSVTWSAPAGGGPNPSPNPDPNAPPPPSITAPSPADGAVVTKPVSVTATIAPPAGQTITSWRVFYQALDPGPEVVIASGNGTPPDPLATFDPTVLPNDTYGITVEATASNGAVQDVTTSVVVFGNLKVGRFTTTYQDLSVPVSGFQMEVRRTYDSIDKSPGDFGVGWKVGLSNFRVAPNHVLGAAGWTMFNKQCFFGICITGYKNSAPRYITVTFPDQHTELFDFTPQGGTNIFWECTPQFTARGSSGTTSKLEPIDDVSCSYTGDGNLYGSNGPYSPRRFRLTTRDGQVLVLDANLGLISATDTSGNTLTVDATGLHSSSGGSITYTRDANGRITIVTGPAGETLRYSYNASGDLVTSVDANGRSTAYTYDSNHDLLTASGAAQPLQSSEYDASGRIISITDALGNKTSITNDVQGQEQVLTDPAGRMTTVLHFDDLGDVVRTDKIADATTITTRATFDSVGRMLTETDALGHTQTMQYDASGNMISFTDPNGARFNIAYNSFGEVVGVTDSAGASLSSYVYDAAGRLTQVNDPDCTGCRNTYDASGKVLTHTDGMGGVTTYAYDAAGHATALMDARGDSFTMTWDASGHLLSRTDPTGHTAHFSYDAEGRVLSQADGLGHSSSATYDAHGSILTATDPLGNTTSYTYDGAGRQVSVTERTGATVNFSYDADGRLTVETLPGGDTTTRTYDGFGRLIQIANRSATVAFTFDPGGRIASTTSSGTAGDPLPTTTFDYTYDANGNRLTSAGPDGTITNTYDNLGRLTRLTDPSGGVFQLGFDAAQRLTSLSRPNGVRDAFTYDVSGDLLSRVASNAGGSTLASFTYTYGAGRMRLSAADSNGTAIYAYDKLLRLTGVSGAAQESYQYDAASNRSAAQNALGTFVYTYDAAGRLLSDGKFNFTYDAEGNLITKVDRSTAATTTYSYNARHQLLGVQLPNRSTTTYQYDPLGRRVAISANGVVTRYAYDGDALRLEYSGANALTASYVSGVGIDSPLEMRRGNNAYFYVQDGLGSVRALTDASGAVVQTYSYDAFGNQTVSGGIANPFSYTSREFDPTTGLYYYRARYYDPTTGRFLSEDPLPSMNAYVYAADDPTNLTDPTGAAAISELAIRFILIGAIAGALSNAITTALLECRAGCFDWRDVLVAGFAGFIGGGVTNALTLFGGWFVGGAAGGALEGGIQDLGNQLIHHPGHVDPGEVVASGAAGAGAGVVAGVFGGGDYGVTSVAGGYYRNALGQFAENPGIIDAAIPDLVGGFFIGMLQDAHRANSVCP